MAKLSAGILRYKWVDRQLQVLLVHPGGPFWKNKDLGSWSVPKGEYDEGEDPLILLCYKVDTSVSIYLALATSGQYVEDDEPPATGFLPSTCPSASLSGRSDPGRWACRSRCPHRELHQRPHAADRAQERRADGRASGSRQRAPDAPVAASHRGRRGLER